MPYRSYHRFWSLPKRTGVSSRREPLGLTRTFVPVFCVTRSLKGSPEGMYFAFHARKCSCGTQVCANTPKVRTRVSAVPGPGERVRQSRPVQGVCLKANFRRFIVNKIKSVKRCVSESNGKTIGVSETELQCSMR